MNVLRKFLARAVALGALNVVALVLIDVSDTTDPLGPGLLLFLVMILVALVWGVLDGRGRALESMLVWLLVSVALGIVFTVGTGLVYDSSTIELGDLGGTVAFATALLLPPALLGIGIGALISRHRD